MIEFDILRQKYEEATGYTMYQDFGEMLHAIREKNTIDFQPCGLFAMQPFTLTAIQTPLIGMATANVTVIAPEHMTEDVKDHLNQCASVLNGTAFHMTVALDNGEELYNTDYSVSYNCQTAFVGDKLDIGVGTGTAFSIHQTISYIIVEQGISAYDIKLRIDGMNCPVLTLVETNVHTTSVYPDGNGTGKTISEAEAFGIDFTTPYLNNKLGTIFQSATNKITHNQLHCVEIEKNGTVFAYMMAFSSVSDTVQPPQNVGFNVSMTEVVPMACQLNGFWKHNTCDTKIVTVDLGNHFQEIDYTIVFWGDGTFDIYNKNNLDSLSLSQPYKQHIYQDGRKNHEMYVFNKYIDDTIPVNALSGVNPTNGRTLYCKGFVNEEMSPALSADGYLATFSDGSKIVINENDSYRAYYRPYDSPYYYYFDSFDQKDKYFYVKDGTAITVNNSNIDFVGDNDVFYFDRWEYYKE